MRPSTLETTMPLALLSGAEFFVIVSTCRLLGSMGQSGLVGCCDFLVLLLGRS